MNAAHVLVRMLREVRRTPTAEPGAELRAGVVPPTDAERDSWSGCPRAPTRSPRSARPTVAPGAGDEFYERTGAATAVDVNMIEVGEPRTIVPSVARAT